VLNELCVDERERHLFLRFYWHRYLSLVGRADTLA
jgi:hypothetical protein